MTRCEQAYTVITEQIGYLPLRPDSVNDPTYLKGWIDQHPLMQSNLQQVTHLVPWESIPGPNYQQVQTTLICPRVRAGGTRAYHNAVQQVVYSGADPTATMQDAEKRAQALMP